MTQPLSQPYPVEQAPRLGAGIRDLHPPHQQRHRDVLERRELRQQMVKLVHETPARDCVRRRAPARSARGCPSRRPTPGRWWVDRGRPESATRWSCRSPEAPDDGDALADGDGHRNTLQHFEGDRSLLEALVDATGLENRERSSDDTHNITHVAGPAQALCGTRATRDRSSRGRTKRRRRRRSAARPSPRRRSEDR